MILRRIIAHFRKQEWTAIAIDFVIVLTGVFAGIQVSNWNADRIEASQEGKYLSRLHDDVTTALGKEGDRLTFSDQVSHRMQIQSELKAVVRLLSEPTDKLELTGSQCASIVIWSGCGITQDSKMT